MWNWRPLLRVPVLSLGLGALAGSLEAVAIAATTKLHLGLLEAATAMGSALVVDALVAAAMGLVAGALTEVVPSPGRTVRTARGVAATAFGLGAFFLVHAALEMVEQDRLPAAIAFAVCPVGIAGVVYFNALYWLRREDAGERRRFGWLATSALAASVVALGAAALTAQRTYGSPKALAEDPSVVVVTVDTLRRDHLSAYGASPVATPVFDALAARGVRFDDAITPFPETAPAHAALWTGRHPARNGVLSNGHALARGYETLAEVLADEGFATGAFVSSFAVDSRTGLDQGFEVYDDDFFGALPGASEILAVHLALRALMRFGDPLDVPFLLEREAPTTYGRALAWVDEVADQPFLLWVHLFEPHAPYEPHGMPGFEDNGTRESPSLDHRALLGSGAPLLGDPVVEERLRRLYAEEVAYTDAQLGLFLDALASRLGKRPYVLVVTADHGEMLGEHGVPFTHHGLWEEVVRVPLAMVLHDTRVYTAEVPQQVRLMDVPATVLSQLGLDPMEHSEGADLVAYAQNLRTQSLSSLLVGRAEGDRHAGLLCGYRTGNAKLLAFPEGPRLFDLAASRADQVDIAPAQADAVAKLGGLVRSECPAASDGGTVDAATRAALEALGYVSP